MAKTSGRSLGQAVAPLDPTEEEKATEEERLNASVIHEVIRREGVKEMRRQPAALAWSGLAGGLSMGLTLLTTAVLHHALPEAPWRHTLASLGYSAGFLVVILGSQQLYTENTLSPVVPLLSRPAGHLLRKVLTAWVVVLVANVIGTAFFAYGMALTAAIPPEVRQAMRALALEATSHDWWTMFARGIVAGWIIALMVWMLPASSGGAHLWVIIIMTWLVGAAKLSHVIVTSVESFYLVALGDLGIGRTLGGLILPALLGNTIGGFGLVAVLNHAQVKAE